jgi:uncharacterized membrane protein
MANLLQGGKGRPLHPLLVHYPSALYPTSLLFDGLSHLAADGGPFVKGAFALIVTGLVISVAAAAAGFADFLPIDGGSRTWRLAVLHMTSQLVTAGLFLANAILRSRDLDVTTSPVGPVILSVCGVLVLWLGNLLGAELVYRHGRRVEPQVPAAVPAAEPPAGAAEEPGEGRGA